MARKKDVPRPEIPLTEKCLFQLEKMDASDDWCKLPINDKRSYTQCAAKRLRTENPQMTFSESMKKAWDVFRETCKGEVAEGK